MISFIPTEQGDVKWKGTSLQGRCIMTCLCQLSTEAYVLHLPEDQEDEVRFENYRALSYNSTMMFCGETDLNLLTNYNYFDAVHEFISSTDSL